MNIQMNWRKWRLNSCVDYHFGSGRAILGGCSLGDSTGNDGKGGLPVVATVYPAYDIAKQVAG